MYVIYKPKFTLMCIVMDNILYPLLYSIVSKIAILYYIFIMILYYILQYNLLTYIIYKLKFTWKA